MGTLLTDYNAGDQQKIKDWMKQQGGAADMGMAVSALKVKPITTVPPANNSAMNNNAPAQNPSSLVTQKGTNQYITAFTGREQEGFDSWRDMLAGKSGGSFLPKDIESSIRGKYEKEGDRAFNNTIGNLSSLTGGRVGAAASAAASQARNAYSEQAGNAISNANLQYAQMLLNGMGNYTNAVSGRDDAAYGRDFSERQQGFNNNMAIGEATGYLPTNTMNVNNPWIKDGKAVEGVDLQGIINAKKAINPNDPDIPLLDAARNLKIWSDPELMKKYGSTMSSNIGYETLSGKKVTADTANNNALAALKAAEQRYNQDPNNPENRAKLIQAQATASNANTNAGQLGWEKDPNNPANILKMKQANQGTGDNGAIANMTSWIYGAKSNEEALQRLKQNKSLVLKQLIESGYNTNDALQYYTALEGDLSGTVTDSYSEPK
jgi:hypothetical protein